MVGSPKTALVRGKKAEAIGRSVRTGDGDELPNKAVGGQLLGVIFDVIVAQAVSRPVEGGRQVVGQHCVGVHLWLGDAGQGSVRGVERLRPS